ncbi:MAG: sporulation integral membrane protein YtvI [Lachnospiraceae bacterium]|nr:sporulation integral membrane protein YtvI [Lachnospiraceae bacterium]
MTEWRRIGRILLNIAIPLIEFVLICLLGPKLFRFFIPFIIGGLIAMIANPLVRFLEKRIKLKRKHSSALLMVAVLALVIVGGYFLLAAIGREIGGFLSTLPDLLESVKGDIIRMGENLSRIVAGLPEEVQVSVNKFTGNLSGYLGDLIAAIGAPTMNAVGNITRSLPSLLVNVVVMILSAYFFLADREKVGAFTRKVLPKSWLKAIDLIQGNFKRIVGGYFAAQFKIMLVIIVVLYIGFLILRINYAFLLAVLIAILDFLPVFGTGTVLIPWGVFEMLSGDLHMTIGLIVIYVASQGFHQAVQPKMVGDSMGLNPMYTLFLLFVGFRFYGIGGMILAVPVGMILEDMYHAGMFDEFFRNLRRLAEEIRKLRELPPDEEDFLKDGNEK